MKSSTAFVLALIAFIVFQLFVIGGGLMYMIEKWHNVYLCDKNIFEDERETFFQFPAIDLDRPSLADVAQCARLGYLRECHQLEMPLGYQMIWASSDPVCGFVVRTRDDDMMVIFRGTWNLQEIGRNWNYGLVKSTCTNLEGRVHRGYHSGLLTVRSSLHEVLREARRVLFTGHSMGAVYASIAAIDWATSNPEKQAELIGFGSARCGDKEFSEHQPANLRGTLVFNTGDVAGTWPPCKDYQHLTWAEKVYITYELGTMGQNHSSRSYVGELLRRR